MSKAKPKNIAASVRQKLLNLSHKQGEPFEQVAISYALERMLYRLSLSSRADRFILKGAILFRYWLPELRRPTLDMDLLGLGFHDVEEVLSVFKEALSLPVPDDGLIFDGDTLQGSFIREGNQYHGVRVQLQSWLTTAKLSLQFDIGFGDAVLPKPIMMDLPPLLSFPSARIAAYSRYSTVTEKFQAMTTLALRNSRMKDYFDIWILSQHFSFDGGTLREALEATFSRRNTPMPSEMPVGLSAEFGEATDKQAQWRGFLRRIGSKEDAPFPVIVKEIAAFLGPILFPADKKRLRNLKWAAKGPWLNINKL